MLNQDTKRKIDSARDILVGKVPDPKAQVEQITTALIYKFMDDLDKESEELGGKPRFFVNEFEKYAWTKLFDTRLGGFERLNLYVEALLKMPQNKYIPQLFRDILKDAFLPYRDPETLTLFLKEINEFTYDHSEKLGDAYEYLLSVLGSQGDAGQFRTPRHIIDFIVEVIDPKKDETVLDPACGTAGFLISGYKHILKQNTKERSGDQLTPDEKKRLMSHFMGYDISPDMVRLSLTNMYLHSFPSPNIYEYDTLTNEERWDESYDVIMANPPFMSPKGGIRPHKRFTTQATRSEVLFVDYIAEHLNVNGRAGVIVPEGIIFQSGGAYKSLRKMLVENNYLYAVVSLPAGIFQPYSGVKTSILLMDKSLAKKTDSILFIKVSNEGFDLGAQRRVSKKDDLPQALAILKRYKEALQEGSNFVCDDEEKKIALVVAKERIAKSGEYNFSGERYRESIVRLNQNYPMVDLGDICDLLGGGTPSKEKKSFWENGTINWVSAKHINDMYLFDSDQKITVEAVTSSATNIVPENTIILVTRVSVGKMTITKDTFAINQDLTGISIRDKNRVNTLYLFRILKSLVSQIADDAQGLGVRGVTRDYVKKIRIPLPPIEIQQEIVVELETYQKIIDGAKQVVENYKPTINIDQKWEILDLGEVADISTGTTPSTDRPDYYSGSNAFIKTAEISNVVLREANTYISDDAVREYNLKKFPQGTVLMAMYGQGKTRGQVALLEIPASITQNAAAIQTKERLNSKYLYYYLLGQYERLRVFGIDGHISHLNLGYVKKFKIPIPPIEVQKLIVSRIEEEQKLVEANKRLIEIFEQKIKDKISEVWGEDTASSTDNATTTPVLVG